MAIGPTEGKWDICKYFSCVSKPVVNAYYNNATGVQDTENASQKYDVLVKILSKYSQGHRIYSNCRECGPTANRRSMKGRETQRLFSCPCAFAFAYPHEVCWLPMHDSHAETRELFSSCDKILASISR